jgi:hypothetical protein
MGTKQTVSQSAEAPRKWTPQRGVGRKDGSLWCTSSALTLNNTVMLAVSAAVAHVLIRRKITLHLISPRNCDVRDDRRLKKVKPQHHTIDFSAGENAP